MYTEKIDLFNWTEKEMRRKNFLRLFTAVRTGCYPSMTFKKMNNIRLERFVTLLVEHTVREFRNGVYITSKKTRPKWWPKYLEFIIPITKLKTKIDERKWRSTLRDVIASCSKFYKINLPYDIAPERQFIQPQVTFLESKRRSARKKEYWIDRCRTSDCAIEITRTDTENGLNDIVNLPSDVKLPVVKLFDITKDLQQFIRCLKIPKVKLVDILKYPVVKKTKRKLCTFKIKYPSPKLSSLKACVRLHDIFEKPKDVQYTKDDFMQYFSLNRSDISTETSTSTTKPILRRILKNNVIPISSDLARSALQARTIPFKCDSSWKVHKLEWHLRERPQVKYTQQYAVTYDRSQDLEQEHTYVFPKRQQHQNHQTLRLYSRLRKCKPVCVKLERLDLANLENTYVQN